MKNKLLLLSILIIPIIIFTSCSSGGLVPVALTTSTQETVALVKQENEDVFTKIQKNVDMISDLKSRAEESKANNAPLSLDEVIEEMETITVSYENLASQREDIKSNLLNKIKSVEEIQGRVDEEITILRERKSYYTEQLADMDGTSAETQRTRSKALNKAIEYTDAQIDLWSQFYDIEYNIGSEMIGIQEKIDNFLSLIESSAIVFREGLNLLKLQKDISDALSLFTDLPKIEQLSRDMENSWNDLDYLLGSLTNLTNNVPSTVSVVE